MEALAYVASGFLTRFLFLVQVRYKAESVKAKQRSNEVMTRPMGQGEQRQRDFKPPALNLMGFLERPFKSCMAFK